MALWRLYYHLVWGTKNRYPYLTTEKFKKLYSYIISKADSLFSITHAVGGIEDHIHLVISIPPKISIAYFVKQIKGSSAHFLNNNFDDNIKFFWQEGYGVFSLGKQQLEQAVSYVNNQKQHHQQKTIISLLEQTDSEDNPPEAKYLFPSNRF